MKIAIFHNVPPGGARRVVYNQIAYLSKGHSVSLYMFIQESTEKDFLDFTKLNCNIYFFPGDIYKKRHRLVRDIYLFWKLKSLHKKAAEIIDQCNYDVVIVHPDRLTQSPYILRFLETPSIYYCEEWLRIIYEPQFSIQSSLSFHKKIYENLFRFYLKINDKRNIASLSHIIANSDYTAENIMKAYKKESIVITPSVDTDTFYPEYKRKLYDLLFIGSKDEINGYTLLVEAIALLQNKPRVHIVSLSKESVIDDKAMLDLYNSSRIVVSLSRNEPFGLVVIEAMACGRPVIALATGGHRQTVQNGKNGYLINNAKELAEHIKELLHSQLIQDMFGKNGRKFVTKYKSNEVQGKMLIKYIKSSI